jgi:hypothetical protein
MSVFEMTLCCVVLLRINGFRAFEITMRQPCPRRMVTVQYERAAVVLL